MKDDFLFITSSKKLHKISVKAILYIEAMDDYVRIHLSDSKSLVTRMTMKVMLNQLDKEAFIRVHRSYIVPVKYIEAIGSTSLIVNGIEIAVGKKYADEVLTAFKRDN